MRLPPLYTIEMTWQILNNGKATYMTLMVN